MNKSSVQFLSTRMEIIKFIEELRTNAVVTIATANYESPNKLSILQTDEPISSISKCSFIYLKLGTFFEKTNSLFIYVGQDNDICIRESFIAIKGDGDEFEYWKKQISKFKRTLLKGAYGVNPHFNSKVYYKDVYYTKGAKVAFDKGVQIKPIAGWNHYLLGEP